MLRSVARSFTISRLFVLLSAALGYLLLPSVHEGISVPLPASPPWLLGMWYQWDANWYMSIALTGYHWVTGDQSNVAFFPLYPFAVRAAGWVLGGRYLMAGLLLSLAFMAVGLGFLYRLVQRDFGQDVAGRTVWLMAIFPTSMFFSTIYSESLFMMTSVAAFYYARRNRWAAAGIWGLLASMTRVTGLLLLIPLAYEYLSQRSFSPLKTLRPVALWLMLVPAGVAVYMGYLYLGFGHPLAFAETQAAGWGHQLNPALWGSITHDFSFLFGQSEKWVIYEMAATVMFAALIILGVKRLPRTYIIYMLISLLFPLISGTTKSVTRYMVVVFPLFIVLALLTRKQPWRWAVSGISLALLGVAAAAFATGRWVA